MIKDITKSQSSGLYAHSMPVIEEDNRSVKSHGTVKSRRSTTSHVSRTSSRLRKEPADKVTKDDTFIADIVRKQPVEGRSEAS